MSPLPRQPHPAAGPCLKFIISIPKTSSMRQMTLFFTRLFIALLVSLSVVGPIAAQSNPTQLTSLAVELWPDYDRPSMLVLLTAALPESAPLPATLTIPLPTGAEIHAVASFNEAGALMADVDYTVENGQLTLTTPANRFRVEYYTPYQAEGGEYSYTFGWVSDLAIDQVTTVVQQPAAATDFRINPAATTSAAERGDGLTYHTLPSRPLGAGEPFTVEVAYTADEPALSAPPQTQPTTDANTTTPDPAAATGSGFDPIWLLVGAGVLALVGGAWYIGQHQGRSASRARKPQPTRATKPKATESKRPANSTRAASGPKFCHNCGRQSQPGDTFCRSCGTQLKED